MKKGESLTETAKTAAADTSQGCMYSSMIKWSIKGFTILGNKHYYVPVCILCVYHEVIQFCSLLEGTCESQVSVSVWYFAL